jgi:hypothetical protein
MKFRAVLVGLALALQCALPFSAHADSDTLAPLTFANFAAAFKAKLRQANVHDGVAEEKCLPGAPDKRPVCSYKVGAFLAVIATGEKGGDRPVSLMLACVKQTVADSTKCILGYAAAITLTAPDLSGDQRGKLIDTLFGGLAIGNTVSVTTDDRKYVVEKGAGIMFYIEASDSTEAGD